MSALAELCFDKGYRVLGSDKEESGTVKRLCRLGISVEIGEKGEGLDTAALVVYTLAVPPSHPLLARARLLGIPTVPRPDFLGALAARYARCACIAGMHGKSSTVGMCASIFSAAALDATVLSGAPLSREEGCYRKGGEGLLLLEACEYKGAFLSFPATHAAILNMEWEHTDYYKSEREVEAAFSRFAQKPTLACLVLPAVSPLRPKGAALLTFGEGGDVYAAEKEEREGRFSFTLCYKEEELGRVALQVLGEYQVENALAAAALALALGVPKERLAEGLSAYKGTPRRMEKIGTVGGSPLYLDYAHHPTELAATLAAARSLGEVSLVFQPHTYSRAAAFREDFRRLFSAIPRCGVLPVYAARESPERGIDTKHLISGSGATLLPDFESAADFLAAGAGEGKILLLVGAGDVEKLLSFLTFAENGKK